MKKTNSPHRIGVIALEALKGVLSIRQIAEKYDVEPDQVEIWQRELLGVLKEGLAASPANDSSNGLEQSPSDSGGLRSDPPIKPGTKATADIQWPVDHRI